MYKSRFLFLHRPDLIHVACNVLSHRRHVSMDRIVRIRYDGQEMGRQLIVPVMTSRQAFQQGVAFGGDGTVGFLGPRQSCVQLLGVPLQHVQSCFDGVRHLLLNRVSRARRRRNDGHLGRGGKRLAMNQGVPAGSTLDLPQTHQIAALEVARAVLELPQRGVG